MARWADVILRAPYTWTSSIHDAQDICQTVLLLGTAAAVSVSLWENYFGAWTRDSKR